MNRSTQPKRAEGVDGKEYEGRDVCQNPAGLNLFQNHLSPHPPSKNIFDVTFHQVDPTTNKMSVSSGANMDIIEAIVKNMKLSSR